jgi:hypothetical protein
MVVPIHKKWEASLARVQVVKQDKVIQLLAFFNDFNHGKCMNFVVKGTDRMEPLGRAGKFGIRIVDAKFALPNMEEDAASDFVCLDMPEYPMEHDDITIAFDTESGMCTSHMERMMLTLTRPVEFPSCDARVTSGAVEDGITATLIAIEQEHTALLWTQYTLHVTMHMTSRAAPPPLPFSNSPSPDQTRPDQTISCPRTRQLAPLLAHSGQTTH